MAALILRVRDAMGIEDADGRTLAMVKKALISPLRDRMSVSVNGGEDLDVHGNILDHECSIEAGREKVAEVSKRWFRVADAYGMEIAPGQDDVLLLAVTVVIDAMTHEGRLALPAALASAGAIPGFARRVVPLGRWAMRLGGCRPSRRRPRARPDPLPIS